MEENREHYLDNSATTRVLPEAARKAAEVMVEEYGNPSSLHTQGLPGPAGTGSIPGNSCRQAGRKTGGAVLHKRRHGGKQPGFVRCSTG